MLLAYAQGLPIVPVAALVQRFVRALVRGYRDAAADPEAAIDILLRGSG